MEGTVSPLPPICPRSSEKNAHILVGVTGSVAALKLPLLVEELLKIPGLEVLVVTTENAKHFYKFTNCATDLMLVAPLDANTLAKIANGICDNLL
ncbi:hypothetical protein E2320_013331, partial [Naja naja]